jgi:hypothetical protein
MGSLVLVMFGALSVTAVACADTHRIAWEGDGWPENQGWIRCYERAETARDGVYW